MRLSQWRNEGKDYLFAGITTGDEDGFIAQHCSASSQYFNPAVYCDPLDGRDAVIRTYGNSDPNTRIRGGQQLAILKPALQQYEASIYNLLYDTLPLARNKLYTHIMATTPTERYDFTDAGFNGYSHFGASFYPNEVNSATLSNLLQLANNDNWSVSEIGPNEVTSTLTNLLSALPNNKLVVINTFESLQGQYPQDALAQIHSYLSNPSPPSSANRTYSGALSSSSQTLFLPVTPPNNCSNVNLSWVTNYAHASETGNALKLRYFIDDNSDNTYDEPYGYIISDPLPTSGIQSVQVCMNNSTTRTYVYELVSGRNQSHVLAVEKVRLYASTPYSGSLVSLPGAVEAENYDLGGEGLAYHDSDPANVGGAYRTSEGVDIWSCGNCSNYNLVGAAVAGEWLKYSVNVTGSGSYAFQARVACQGIDIHNPNCGSYHLEDEDGHNLTGPVNVPNTGNWFGFVITPAPGITISLPSGPHVLKLVLDSNGNGNFVGNFDYFMLK